MAVGIRAVAGSRDLGRFLGGYYFANLAAIACYFALRFRYSTLYSVNMFKSSGEKLYFDNATWACVGALLISKQVRSATSLDAFLAAAFTYTKLAILVLAFVTNWRAGAYFLLAFLLLFVLFPQPMYRGDSRAQLLTPASFQQLVLDAAPGDGPWIVAFTAPWSSACVQFEPIFAGLANKYTTDTLRFGKLEITRWSHLAKTLKIEIGISSLQLPTLVMFDRGQELGRMPFVDQNSGVVPWKATAKAVAEGFELQKRYEQGTS